VTGIDKATVLACAEHRATAVPTSCREPSHPSAVALLEEVKTIGTGSVTQMRLDASDQAECVEVLDAALIPLGGRDGTYIGVVPIGEMTEMGTRIDVAERGDWDAISRALKPV